MYGLEDGKEEAEDDEFEEEDVVAGITGVAEEEEEEEEDGVEGERAADVESGRIPWRETRDKEEGSKDGGCKSTCALCMLADARPLTRSAERSDAMGFCFFLNCKRVPSRVVSRPCFTTNPTARRRVGKC